MGINYWHEYLPDAFYHIYNRSSHSNNIFHDVEDYNFFINRYKKYFSNFFDTYAYCLLPNHYHFLIKVKKEKDFRPKLQFVKITNTINLYLKGEISMNELVEDQFRRFHSSYALTLNNKHNTRGQVFMNRHKRILEESEAKVEYILCYIHHNPIHHNFCTNYTEWRFNSYLDYINRDSHIVNLKSGLQFLGGYDRFISIHELFKFEKLMEIEQI